MSATTGIGEILVELLPCEVEIPTQPLKKISLKEIQDTNKSKEKKDFLRHFRILKDVWENK